MLGPVFEFEWERGNQRGWLDPLRRLYSVALVLQLVVYAGSEKIHELAQAWLAVFFAQQLVVIVVATPIFVARGIGDEKSCGSLQFLLTTELTSWEIVLGKCLGRLAQLALLLLVALPLVCFLVVFAGFRLTTVLALTSFTVAFLVAVGAASILAAVWTRRTRDAVLALYMVTAACFLCGWALRHFVLQPAGATHLDSALNHFNLLGLLEPMWKCPDAEELAYRLFMASLAWSGLAVVCLLLAVWRLRGAYIKQLQGRPRRGTGRWLRRPAPTDDPLRWKESQVEKGVPLPILGAVPAWLGITVLFIALLAWSGYALWQHTDPRLVLLQQGLVVALLASLIVGVRASSAVTGERERNTWEMLLATPLDARELLEGKLKGILDAMIPFLIAYALFSLIPAVVAVDLIAAALTAMGVALTWLAMYNVGAAGILCSVQAKSSGESLISTLTTGYGLLFRYFGVGPGPLGLLSAAAYVFLLVVVYSLLNPVDPALVHIAVGVLCICLIGPGLAMWRRAQEYLDSAAHFVDRRERVFRKAQEYERLTP
jgi:ABC-type transport system involved in multi-copper enzyme maturation permease subunit